MIHSMIPIRWLLLSQAMLLGLSALALAQTSSADEPIDFSTQIRPILAAHCYSCHGPDESSRAAKLRLDVRDSAVAQSAIVPHHADQSHLVQRIKSTDSDTQMPPPSSKKPLSESQKTLLARWIEQGAAYSNHWSFVAPTKTDLPKLSNLNWGSSAIDQFIGKRLEQEKLKPSSKADRAALLRRVSLDLIGLPPTTAELNEFLGDNSENAYERVVDRLLSSKHFAEKMALEWLDLARYADTNGYNNDEDRTMWPWRDWVINAYDKNMPFNQFAIEQLAGDLLPSPTQSQLIATGFLRNQGHNTEGGIIQEEYRVEYVADRVHTVSTVFLGLSMQCARCHDHKYDPITQKEYYQFYAFFNSLDEKQAGYSKFIGAEPFIRVATEDQAAKVKTLDGQLADLQNTLKQLEDQAQTKVEKFVTETPESDLKVRFAQAALFRFPLDNSDDTSLPEAISNSKLGKITGGASWQEGKNQQAIELAENTRVELGEIGQFSSERPFSISVWVKPKNNASMAILSKMDESQNYRGYDLLWAGGKIEMHLVDKWPDNSIKVSTKKAIPADQWHHIVATYDGSRTAAGLKIYVDSKLEACDTPQNSLKGSIETQQPFRIGLRQTNLPYQGLIDELQLFGSQLELENVSQLFSLAPVTGFADWVRVPSDQRTEQQQKQIQQFYLNRIDAEYPKVQTNIAQVKKDKAAIEDSYPAVMVLRDVNPPRETFILKRGQYDQPTDKVSAKVPEALLTGSNDAPTDRLALAKWIASDTNPLTARVTVNRWWQNYFGVGLVKTAEDFGLTGDAPSNLALLDFLSQQFIQSGWDIKAMQKMIVMSATYQQDSRVTPEMLERDPENRLLARGPRHRLPAEMIRDNALMISGLLQLRIGGPSVKPYQPAGLWEDVTVERRGKYVADTGEGLYRRSLYTFWKRTCPPPSMMSFDAPIREVCLARRARTNTPLQSLILMNDPTYVECARLLAQAMIREGGPSAQGRIDAGMMRAVARKGTEAEKQILVGILETAKTKFSSGSSNPTSFNTIGSTPPDATIDPIELASWTVVASTLLNLDETISKR